MSKFLQILAFMYHLAEKNPIYFNKAQMARVLAFGNACQNIKDII